MAKYMTLLRKDVESVKLDVF